MDNFENENYNIKDGITFIKCNFDVYIFHLKMFILRMWNTATWGAHS